MKGSRDRAKGLGPMLSCKSLAVEICYRKHRGLTLSGTHFAAQSVSDDCWHFTFRRKTSRRRFELVRPRPSSVPLIYRYGAHKTSTE